MENSVDGKQNPSLSSSLSPHRFGVDSGQRTFSTTERNSITSIVLSCKYFSIIYWSVLIGGNGVVQIFYRHTSIYLVSSTQLSAIC